MSKIAGTHLPGDLVHFCHPHLKVDILELAVQEGKEIFLIPLTKHLVQVDLPPVEILVEAVQLQFTKTTILKIMSFTLSYVTLNR